MTTNFDFDFLQSARRTITLEQEAIGHLIDRLSTDFAIALAGMHVSYVE